MFLQQYKKIFTYPVYSPMEANLTIQEDLDKNNEESEENPEKEIEKPVEK
jgi:hypothetical protein